MTAAQIMNGNSPTFPFGFPLELASEEASEDYRGHVRKSCHSELWMTPRKG
jgi:hypothetical protein